MIKQPIHFTSYDGVDKVQDFYFNITKKELLELGIHDKMRRMEELEEFFTQPNEASTDEQKVVAVQKFITIVEEFVMASYGVRSADGEYFEKSEDLLKKFQSHAAYSDFLLGFVDDVAGAAAFIRGIVPAKLMAEAESMQGKIPEKTPSQLAREASEARFQGHKSAVVAPAPLYETVPEPAVTRSSFVDVPLETAKPVLTAAQLANMPPEAIAAYYAN